MNKGRSTDSVYNNLEGDTICILTFTEGSKARQEINKSNCSGKSHE